MRITFVLPHFGLSGGNRVVAKLAGLLEKRGHDVLLVSQPAPVLPLKRQITSFLRTGSIPRLGEGKKYLTNNAVRHKILDSRRPVVDSDLPDADVIVATWWETAFWVASLSLQKGSKFYFVQGHEVHFPLPFQISRGSYYLPMKKIAVSQWLVDVMAYEYGDRNVALVPNSVDMRQFHAPARGRQAVPTVGLMYSHIPLKGIDIALRAFHKARGTMPGLRLVAFGAKDQSPHLPLPSGCVYWKNPAQDELRRIYASCDVWLFSSRAEGFGLPLLEAMACRTPVVATNAGAAADLIRDGENGYIVGVGDSDALADRILKVMGMPEEKWKAMSDAALEVAQGYTWEDAALLFEKVLLAELQKPFVLG